MLPPRKGHGAEHITRIKGAVFLPCSDAEQVTRIKDAVFHVVERCSSGPYWEGLYPSEVLGLSVNDVAMHMHQEQALEKPF